MTTTRTPAVSRHAFSLLELTLVLLIIGLLGAVAGLSFAGAGERARIKTTKATMVTFKTGLTLYAGEKGSMPASLNDLITGKYVEPQNDGTPPADGWDNPYYYVLTPGGSREFDLISAGKDGELNTEDDIGIWDVDLTN